MGLAFWESGCTTLPFFEPCPYTWKGEIFHFSWNLEISFFFPIYLLKLEYIRTFILLLGFSFNEKVKSLKIPQESVSVTEIFCTLLQCKVHLSMFHSFPISKIWYTST
jgi:hypothetical protein